MPLLSSQFPKELEMGLNAVFGLDYKQYPEEWRAIFGAPNKARKRVEEDVLLSAFAAAPVKAEGAAVTYDSAQEAWTASYTVETIALAFAISEELVEDNLYMDTGSKYAKALSKSMAHTKELKGANVLNRGFNSSYPGGDGKELFSTSHPLTPGGTWSNTFTTQADLSEAALEDACISISKFTDERGIPMAAVPTKLIIPSDLPFIAQRILMSPLRSGTGDNDLNALKTMGKIPGGFSVNHRLTDTDAWFLITDVQNGLKVFEKGGIKKKVEGDFETGNMRYRVRERYVFGWSDPRGAFGSSGAS